MILTNHQEWEKVDPFAELENLRNNFSDEIPGTVISGSPDSKGSYKVTKNWWTGVVGQIGNILREGNMPETILKEAENFVKKFTSSEFYERLTLPEDIKEANDLIDKILESQKPKE